MNIPTTRYIQRVFFFIGIVMFAPLSLSPPVVSQTRDHIARYFPPFPPWLVLCIFIARGVKPVLAWSTIKYGRIEIAKTAFQRYEPRQSSASYCPNVLPVSLHERSKLKMFRYVLSGRARSAGYVWPQSATNPHHHTSRR